MLEPSLAKPEPQLSRAVVDPRKMIDGFSDRTVLVIGDFMIDRYVNSQGRKLSREAPVPVADYISEELVLGGAGNLTNNLLSLGAHVKVIGVAGKDEAGKWLRDELEKKGVDLTGLISSQVRMW
jgi:D-beta-D-heptose 7-phosphate kinase/D-beta-D-heptose 1-phosphate adenosyltransferase